MNCGSTVRQLILKITWFFDLKHIQLKKRLAILGSTGSIGTQALEVVRQQPENFQIEVLSAFNSAGLLIEQAVEFKPNAVIIGVPDLYDKVASALQPLDIKVYAGEDALCQILEMESIDMVLVALVGYAGLKPTLSAIAAGKQIAIANKETFVVAGELVTRLAQQKGVNLFPVDSEHSAIFQCMAGEFQNPIEKIYLTASGGPFRGKTHEFLSTATRAEALKHPNWNMGCKVTIDSATLMNKGLEVIEARWLFGVPADKIDVVVHPQSVIHSMVQFTDGSIKAQMSPPDMRLPIQYSFTFPDRYKSEFKRYDFLTPSALSFEPPDLQKFPCLALTYKAMERGLGFPCVMNAANEVAVDFFIKQKIKFLDIPFVVEKSMETIPVPENPLLTELVEIDKETREFVKSIL